jgi:hypothetical protein
MEPLMSLEGYLITQDTEKSRNLLNIFYIEQGYKIYDKDDDYLCFINNSKIINK